ncbi:hypothetical protein BC830DRAFT_1133964 [Chytriomyces sp. MP71]|nr:hypothetical protein BC830DRAFT_1133964 [Chytriomyces sp. MP71]
MGNLFVKMPNVSELRDAKPTSPNANIPEPKWFFDIPLRTVMMVVLAAYAIIGLVNLAMSIPFLWNPIFWFFLM